MGYGGDKSGGYKGGGGFGGGFGGGGYKGDGGGKGGGVSLYPNDGGYGGGGGYKGGGGKKGGYFGNNRKGGGKGKNPFGMSYGGGKFDGGGKDSGKSKGGKDGGKSSNPLVGSREIRTLAHQNCNVLQRITAPLPQNLRHWDSVDSLAMMDGKILAGSRDKHMSMWNGEAQSDGRLFLKQFNCTPFHTGITYLLVEASTNWLFVGLFSGQIKAFQQKPEMELVLKGHERAISYLYVYDKFLLSVSRDETFKVWEFSDQSRTFVNNFSAKSPVGELNCLRTIGSDLSNTKIWLGGEKGIACINMQQLVCEGNIPTDAGVVGPFFVYQNDHVVCALKNGSIKCYSTQGALVHEVSASRSTKRVHCSEMMLGPNDTIVFLLGGDFGWITAYSVPELDVIGEFCVNKAEPSRVKSIADCGTGDMFVVGLENGEIYVYKWGNGLGSTPQEQEQQNMANLFAPTGGPVGVAAGPVGGGLGGQMAGGMAGGAPQVNPFTGQAIAGGAGPGMLGGGQMGMGGNDTMMM